MRPLPIIILTTLIFVFLSYSYFFSRKSYILSPVVFQYPAPTLTPTPILSPSITIGLVGDLGLGRHITTIARQKNNFSWSFSEISPWLLQNSFTVANLESPIIKNCPKGETGTFIFCGDDRFLPSLADNRFILSLQNNHILNYGQDGLKQTINYLNSYNISSYYNQLLTKEINGIKLGFLGYDFVTYPKLDHGQILQRVTNSKQEVDFLIVSLHWGNEYLPKPETWRVSFARQLVDAGADIIHGHHPHVWQGVETYNDKLIFYSFGNFILDQSWSYETSHSQIARVTIQKRRPLQYQLFPIEIRFNSQPRLSP